MNPVQFLAHRFPGKTEQEYRQHLGNFQISGLKGLQPIGTLSGGQKSRVAFSVLSLQRPHILLLDEVRSAFSHFLFRLHETFFLIYFLFWESPRITWTWRVLMV